MDMVSYTPAQRQLGVAAVKRYGQSMAARLLAEIWPTMPSTHTLTRWRDDPEVTPTEEHEAFWEEHERRIRQSLLARTSVLIPRVSDVIERLTDPTIALAEIPAADLKHATVAYGILHDKMIPPPTRYGSPTLIGNAEHVTLNVMAPPAATPERRVIDVESTASE